MFERYADNKPIVSAANAINMLPDPKGWLTAENYRWVSFLNKVTKPEARDLGFENVDKLVQKTTNSERIRKSTPCRCSWFCCTSFKYVNC